MSMTTRVATTAAAALLALGLAACGEDKPAADASKDTTSAAATTQAAETQAAETQAAETTAAEQADTPKACEALTAEEASQIVGKKYTTKGGGAGTAQMCSYKGDDPLSPILSLSVNQLGAGTAFDIWAEGVISALDTKGEKVDVPGADEAQIADVKGTVVMVLAKKGNTAYHLQYGAASPDEKAKAKETAKKLAEAMMS